MAQANAGQAVPQQIEVVIGKILIDPEKGAARRSH